MSVVGSTRGGETAPVADATRGDDGDVDRVEHLATDRGGRPGVSMNGAGNIAGLLTEVLPAATVVERMANEAAVRLTAR